MNIAVFSPGTAHGSDTPGVIYGGNLMTRRNAELKSTQEKQERQEELQEEVAYWEDRKDELKEMACDTVEEVAKKLDAFHAYEDSIAAAKQSYNSEQMRHVSDEAEEIGERIAEKAEETAPKTEEKRKEEAAQEATEAATGTEDSDGVFEELLEETAELTEEAEEELLEGSEELAQEDACEVYRLSQDGKWELESSMDFRV